MPHLAYETVRRLQGLAALRAALYEHPFGSDELLDAIEAAEDGGVPLHEIEEALDELENRRGRD